MLFKMFRYNHYITSAHLKRAQSLIAPILNFTKNKINLTKVSNQFWSGKIISDINRDKGWEVVKSFGLIKIQDVSKLNKKEPNIPLLKQKPFLTTLAIPKTSLIIGKRYYSHHPQRDNPMEDIFYCALGAFIIVLGFFGLIFCLTLIGALFEEGHPILGFLTIWALVFTILFFMM